LKKGSKNKLKDDNQKEAKSANFAIIAAAIIYVASI
jgi:hypothetical protein